MAYRGRGRGFGRGRGSYHPAKQVKFELFPDIEDLPDAKNVEEELALIVWSSKLQKFWNSSPYYYEGVGEALKKKESTEIKRISDKDSERTKRKAPLSDYMKMTVEYVPAELVEKKERRGLKKVRWNPDSDLQRLDDFFEKKLEQKPEGKDEKGEKEKKEGEDEGEDDDNIEEEEEEYSTDGDYNQNVDFDDDEDDFNMADDNDDEGIF